MSVTNQKALLRIESLTVCFKTDEGEIRAVENVSFEVGEHESVGLVGESGCGKSVTGLSVLRLIPCPPGWIESGHILFQGRDLLGLSVEELRRIRGRLIGMIFQEPMAALSPLHRIGNQLVETLRTHNRISRRTAWELAAEWLQRVGISDAGRVMYAYPHQLSGGMCQRVMIAMVLMLGPALVIADEPTTSLDVTIQAQILELLREVTANHSSLLLITHDMGIIWEMCNRMVVMYAGEVVETGRTREVFRSPLHPYTEALLSAVPSLRSKVKERILLRGDVPSPLNPPSGCRFHPRCHRVLPVCSKKEPDILEASAGHFVACHLYLSLIHISEP
ncbi:MAG: ABC transporter ATP-binding protein, partial [Kiritimatiellae bacterium]|nr:ABC transporter ATP-binding protein [Kiritimatiellia bacterium]